MGRLLLIAARNLRSNARRTTLLGAAIATVTLLLIVLTSVSNGIQDTMLRAASTLATGHVNIGGFYKITPGQAAPVVTHFAPIMRLIRSKRAALPEQTLVVDRLRGWGKVVSASGSIQVGINGIDVASETNLRRVITLKSGTLAAMKRERTVLLFATQADRLGVTTGDTVTISTFTARGALNAIDVEIVAIAKDMGLLSSFNIFTPKDTVRDMYLLESHATGAIQIYLKDVNRSAEAAGRLRSLLANAGHQIMEAESEPFWLKFPVVTREEWTGQKLDITTWKDELSMLTWIVTAFDTMTIAIVLILLIIIIVGVMNVLLISIRERTREIGTLRAIGMPRRSVLAMFVMEAGLLSLSATMIGSLLGIASVYLLNWVNIPLSEGFAVFLMRDNLRLVLSERSLIIAVLTVSLTTTLFAIVPAYRAARMPPVTAIQHV